MSEIENDVKKDESTVLSNESSFALPKRNLQMIAVGFVVIVIGFICMIGPSSEDTTFNPEIFSPLHITVGPIIAVIGFFFEIFAILWIPKKK